MYNTNTSSVFLKPLFIGLMCSWLMASSCGTGEKANSTSGSASASEKIEYGGCFRIGLNEAVKSFYPLQAVDENSFNVISQVFEGLVKMDVKTMRIIPALANQWTIDSTGREYTFKLNEAVYFHNDPCFKNGKGRVITAEDVKFTFENACKKDDNNLIYNVVLKNRLLGAEDFYNKKSDQLTGVEVINKNTIKFILTKPNHTFLYILSMPSLSILPKEGIEKYGNKLRVGSGPFMLASGQGIRNDKVLLLKNPNYYAKDTLGNQLPYLDSVEFIFKSSKKAELEDFKKASLDIVIGLPAESIKEMVEEEIARFKNDPPRYVLYRSPEMSTQFYLFNHSREIFKDKRVRQALNLAIDRTRIIEEVLKGEAFGPGVNGVTPPSFKGYNISEIKGFDYNPKKAQELLAEAGYPGGKGFPEVKIELNSGGYKNTAIAVDIQKQWMKNLGIRADLEIVSLSKKMEDERYGRADIFRSGWIADYPDPESFLSLFFGKGVPESSSQPSHPNTSRFVNAQFDELFELASQNKNNQERYQLFMKAEQILMDQAALIVLFYEENYILLQSNVRNFYSNPMKYKDFSKIYFREVTSEITKEG